jgi:hypothetical protein
MPAKPRSKSPGAASEYPERTDSLDMAKAARTQVNEMTEEEVEKEVAAAMARVYGGQPAPEAPLTGH